MYQSVENISIERRFVNLSSRQVHYRVSGSGPILVLLHQSPTSSAEMASVIEQFSDEFTVIAPDTPGFGLSDFVDDIKPDIIINPHALPSRMTIGQLVETLMGKACVNIGGYGDCTAFINKGSKHELFGKALTQNGFNKSGNEILYNGMTGEQLQADIFIGELNKELECKLTTRMASGAINFQTDHATLVNKGSLDYLYVIASDDFSEFAVLLFTGLTADEFNDPPESARGKARMIKWKAMEKI